ncbi:MAG: MBL fold metallo-hydrolase, partial [Geminicoccaceae bacterium]|nr:MBL fold metallo-hydrolase [Geminicoccaceae bacterium]
VHVSGHPCRDEVEQMYRWMRPRVAVPVHGEARHLYAHARLAERMGVPRALVVRNGDMVRFAPGDPAVVDEVPTGRMVLETTELVDAEDELYRTRRRLMSHGTVQVVLVFDRFGTMLADPRIASLGALDLESFGQIREDAADAVADAIEEMNDKEVLDDGRVSQAVRAALRQSLKLPRFKRPIVEVQIVRLTPDAIGALEGVRKGAA